MNLARARRRAEYRLSRVQGLRPGPLDVIAPVVIDLAGPVALAAVATRVKCHEWPSAAAIWDMLARRCGVA